MARRDRFRTTDMSPIQRRRELVGLLSRALGRLRRGAESAREDSAAILPDPPCFPGQDTAQCYPRVDAAENARNQA